MDCGHAVEHHARECVRACVHTCVNTFRLVLRVHMKGKGSVSLTCRRLEDEADNSRCGAKATAAIDALLRFLELSLSLLFFLLPFFHSFLFVSVIVILLIFFFFLVTAFFTCFFCSRFVLFFVSLQLSPYRDAAYA